MNMKLSVMALALIFLLLTGCMLRPREADLAPAQSTLPPAQPTQSPTQSVNNRTCPASYPVGYSVIHLGSMTVAVWYPSPDPEVTYSYNKNLTSTLAKDGQPDEGSGPFPLVVFSHGLGGCGTQSIFFTETLARDGYVVAAPDHQDSRLCRIEGDVTALSTATPQAPLYDPKTWTDASYADRRADVETVIDGMLQDSRFKSIVDRTRIGISGHSLGGYTALGMVGGWSSWKDDRIKAVLLFSPYSMPYSIQKTVIDVTIPQMYQGAEGDIGITPFVEGSQGAYGQANSPKYWVKLVKGNHLTWTDAVCAGETQVAACLQNSSQAKLIDDYSIAFFDFYLKAKPQPLLQSSNSSLSAYQHLP